MDFDRHVLFCGECNDYVYDIELDEKIVRYEKLYSSKKINRKREITVIINHYNNRNN
jgi:ubiquitin carboxyl-terminal hydrolase 22/27/51